MKKIMGLHNARGGLQRPHSREAPTTAVCCSTG